MLSVFPCTLFKISITLLLQVSFKGGEGKTDFKVKQKVIFKNIIAVAIERCLRLYCRGARLYSFSKNNSAF